MSESTDEIPAIPAATVVLLRDGADGIETLMLRRNSKLAFAGGSWVWPGGRIDPDDYNANEPDDILTAARRAAVRETNEEAGLVIDDAGLVWFSHWTPPAISPKRFATWFFVAPAPTGDVSIDGGEIHDHRWIAPRTAMQMRNDGEIELHPPTWITLETLKDFASVSAALAELGEQQPEYFATRLASVEGGGVALYHGDAGYETGDGAAVGPRHRLWMIESGWRYERDC
jgi:8-oxo-dGTP pyrophosphatase MutT (NUDIX family)